MNKPADYAAHLSRVRSIHLDKVTLQNLETYT